MIPINTKNNHIKKVYLQILKKPCAISFLITFFKYQKKSILTKCQIFKKYKSYKNLTQFCCLSLSSNITNLKNLEQFLCFYPFFKYYKSQKDHFLYK